MSLVSDAFLMEEVLVSLMWFAATNCFFSIEMECYEVIFEKCPE